VQCILNGCCVQCFFGSSTGNVAALVPTLALPFSYIFYFTEYTVVQNSKIVSSFGGALLLLLYTVRKQILEHKCSWIINSHKILCVEFFFPFFLSIFFVFASSAP
jgi:hypothetical protein